MKNEQKGLALVNPVTTMGFQNEEIEIIKQSVAKGTTDAELMYFLAVAKNTGLNPFQKEIWCYKSGTTMLIFAGRDGFLANAQKKSDFKGIRSAYVCENDKFSMNIPAGHIEHSFDGKERGNITGAYAIVTRDNMNTFIAWASIKEFDKGQNTWNTHKGSMIKKVAESHALKQAYALNGVDSEHDYDFQRNSFSSAEPENEEPVTIHEEIVKIPQPVLTAIKDCKTKEELVEVYTAFPEYQANAEFGTALSTRKGELK